MEDLPTVIARAGGVLGEVVLRRRPAGTATDTAGNATTTAGTETTAGTATTTAGATGRDPARPPDPTGTGSVYELIVNGVFLMDTAETTTERLLAELVLERHPAPRDVLIGGLGLGCTLAALLRDPRPARVEVVEIEPLLVEWLRAGLVPDADRALADPRVRVRVADLREVLSRTEDSGAAAAQPPQPSEQTEPGEPNEANQPATAYEGAGRYDAVVLDVDNGPGFLVHERNAAVYEEPALRAAARALRPGGLLVVWSADPAPALRAGLHAQVGTTEEVVRQVSRQGRCIDYSIYVAVKPDIA